MYQWRVLSRIISPTKRTEAAIKIPHSLSYAKHFQPHILQTLLTKSQIKKNGNVQRLVRNKITESIWLLEQFWSCFSLFLGNIGHSMTAPSECFYWKTLWTKLRKFWIVRKNKKTWAWVDLAIYLIGVDFGILDPWQAKIPDGLKTIFVWIEFIVFPTRENNHSPFFIVQVLEYQNILSVFTDVNFTLNVCLIDNTLWWVHFFIHIRLFFFPSKPISISNNRLSLLLWIVS